MAELIGTVSDAVALAETTIAVSRKCLLLVQAYKSAQERIAIIMTETNRTLAILALLDALMREGRKTGSPLNPGDQSVRTVIKAVEDCDRVFRPLTQELQRVVGDLESRKQPPSRLSFGQKTSWLFRADRVAELRNDLANSRQVILLGLSLTQLSLQLRAPGVPLQSFEQPALEAFIESLADRVVQKTVPVDPPASRSPPGVGRMASMATNNRTVPPVDGNRRSSIPVEKLNRVRKGLVATERLDAAKVNWLNDPFKDGYITIYQDVSDADMRVFLNSSGVDNSTTISSRRRERERERATEKKQKEAQEREELEMKRRKEQMMEMSRKEEEKKPDYVSDLESSAFSLEHPHGAYEDVVSELLSSWTLRPAAASRPCGHRMEKGEKYIACYTCAQDDRAVLCRNCFLNTKHDGHDWNTRVAKYDGQADCDCGDTTCWNRPLSCPH